MNGIVRSRLGAIFFLFISLYSLILFYLLYIQILQHRFYADLAHQQYYVTLKTAAMRGLIVDRYDRPLALNKKGLAAFVMPKEIRDDQALIPFLQRHFPESVKRFSMNRIANFMFIKRRLTQEEVEYITNFGPPELHIITEPSRFYPCQATAQIVGITDIDNNGRSGIEYKYNEQLAGEPTTICLSKDARSGYFYFAKECTQQGTQGKTIPLTIDVDLQFLLIEELKETVRTFSAQEAAALIMDPESGDILAMGSYPICDPNNTRLLDIELTKNKCATESYEVGSVIKPFVALALLAENLVTLSQEFDCENTRETRINNQRVTTWKPHGVIPFEQVVQHSNNIGMAKAALKLDKDLYDHYTRLGFGARSGLQWPAEQAGFITPPQKWSKRSLLSLSFGYEISMTLVQLARAFSVIANGGYLITPRIVTTSDRILPKKLYEKEIVGKVQSILHKTVAEGTAWRAKIEGYEVMGKTGSANMLVNGQYSHERNLFTFVGAVRKGSYNRVLVAFVKDAPGISLFASQVAAPLFSALAKKMIIHEQFMNTRKKDVYTS